MRHGNHTKILLKSEENENIEGTFYFSRYIQRKMCGAAVIVVAIAVYAHTIFTRFILTCKL